MTNIHDPSFICHLPSGSLYLSQMQFLRGYCILVAEPEVSSINDLAPVARTIFLNDMVKVGDAILQVTDAFRINYALMGNNEPILHAHIVPRYTWEPENLRKGLPWDHPDAYTMSTRFNAKRDRELVEQLRKTLSSSKSF